VLADARYALRIARKSPGFTAVAVLTLALGIGAVTSIFSLVNGVLLRPLPYAEPDRLAYVTEAFPKMGMTGLPFSPPDLLALQSLSRSFSGMGAFSSEERELSGIEQPERIQTADVSANLFALLGLQPQIGRSFTADDERQQRPVVVLSHALYRRAFGADPKVVGRPIVLDRVSYTIAGVLAPGVEFPPRGTRFNNVPADAFTLLTFTEEQRRGYGNGFNVSVIGRLAPGVSLTQAQAELDGLVPRLQEPYPANIKSDPRFSLGLGVVLMRDAMVGRSRPLLLILLGAVALLLVVACANVANLLLARAASRTREMALRTALGAGRGRVVRQLLTESLMLGLVGGGIGVLIALWGTDLLLGALPISIPRSEAIQVDLPVLAFAIALSLLTSMVFGLVPAWNLVRHERASDLREGTRGATMGRGRARLLGGLVVTQFALALVLAVSGGLLVRSFVRLLATDPGFRPEQVLTVSTRLPSASYANATQIRNFYRELVERANRIPGVTVAAGGTALPMETTEQRMYTAERPIDPSRQSVTVTTLSCVEGNYFKALGVAIKAGRFFSPQEMQAGLAPRAVIVNETLARKTFGSRDPVGERIKWGSVQSTGQWMTIVGVVADIKHGSLDSAPIPTVYRPFAQVPDEEMTGYFRWLNLAVRAEGASATTLAAALGRQVREMDRSLPVSDVQWLEQRVVASVKPQRFYTLLMAGFAGSALLLAAIGLWGVLAMMVSQRTQEIGVRLALGATQGSVIAMVLRQGLGYAALGGLLGLAGAAAGARLLSGFLYQVSVFDLPTFAGATVVLALVGLAASYLPARRATKVEPVIALRAE
jgi:predicted permease